MFGAFLGVRGIGSCDDDVESALEDGGEGNAFDGVEGEESDGLFETKDNAGGEEIEVACEGEMLVEVARGLIFGVG